MKPQYKHNCYHCKFLGQYTEEDQIYDLYYCPQLGRPTVEAYRKSGEPLPEMFNNGDLRFSYLYD